MERIGQPSPRVSVIVPLYEAREYVAEALDSALAQTFSDLEVIVVDDGSTDGGDQIVHAYAQDDPRVTYIRQKNAGPAAARNAGIAAARGHAIAFLDSDDLWLPEKLAQQMPFVTENTVVHSAAHVLRDGGGIGDERIGGLVAPHAGAEAFETLLKANPIAVLTTVMPRDLLLAHGCFDIDASLRAVEDYDLWLRLAAAGARFEYIPVPLAVYRIRSDSLSADRVRTSNAKLRVYEKMAAVSSPTRRRAVRANMRRERRVLATELWRCGRRAITRGDTAEGRLDLVSAVRVAPGWWKCWVLAGLLALPTTALKPVAVWSERRARLDGSS